MNKTVLQHIVMPPKALASAKALYLKGEGEEFPMTIMKGSMLDLRTFFNSFPSRKYRENADIHEIWLELECEGLPNVTIHRYIGESVSEETIQYNGDLRIELRDEDLIGITIGAKDQDIRFLGGCFYVDKETVNDIHLSHIICTYHKEEELGKKLDSISQACDTYPFMKERLTVYVVDNGNSFDHPGDNAVVIKSDNFGGSGGFSRGLIAALDDGITTHITLNDDDAELDPETIYRTIAFYSFISEDKKEMILGGVFFERDRLYDVHETGAYFEDGVTRSFNRGADVITPEGCVAFERTVLDDSKNPYFAWCYMSTSCDIIRRYGLSLPLFFQRDDAEYGARTKGIPKVMMCGISFWHLSDFGHSVYRSYYRTRNTLAAMASSGLIDRMSIRNVLYGIMINVGCYRYRTAEAQLAAVHDFMKGPDHLFSMIKNGPIRFDEYVFGEPVEGKRVTDQEPVEHSRAFKIITLNGLLLPSKGDLEADMMIDRSDPFYRKKRVFYRSKDGKEVMCERSRIKTLSLIFRTTVDLSYIYLRKRGYTRRYSEKALLYRSEKKWKELFKIDE